MTNRFHRAALCIALGGILALNSGCKKGSSNQTPTPPTPPPPPTQPTPIPTETLQKILNVPVTDVYVRGAIRAEIHDGNADPNYQFTPDEKRILYNVLDVLPEANIKGLKYVGVVSDTQFRPGVASAASGPNYLLYLVHSNAFPAVTSLGNVPSVLGGSRTKITAPTQDAGLSWFMIGTMYELGNQTALTGISSAERSDWQTLHQVSMDNSDFAPLYLNLSPDAQNAQEDFASVHAELGLNPANAFLTALNTLQQNGRGVLFQKYLYMSSLFADPNTSTINFATMNLRSLTAYVNTASYALTGSQFRITLNCAGKDSSCVPLDMTMDLNSNQEITRITYTKNGALVTVTPPQTIPLPQTLKQRLSFPRPALVAPKPIGTLSNTGLSPSDPTWALSLMKDIGSSQVTSPYPPTHYVAATAVALPAYSDTNPPTFEDLIRPHGNFAIIRPKK